MEGACIVLSSISTDAAGNEESTREELGAFKLALQELLRLLEGVLEEEDGGVLARVLVVAAGHSGRHYWTDAENRQLANG